MQTAAGPELEIAKTALTVSREAVLKQQADVRELRVIAAALLTGTSVAVSFLGGRALDSGKEVELAFVGLLFVVGSLLAIIRVRPGCRSNATSGCGRSAADRRCCGYPSSRSAPATSTRTNGSRPPTTTSTTTTRRA